MERVFSAKISLILGLVVCCVDHQTVSTISVSDYEVKTAEVNSDIKFACFIDRSSLLTTLKYSKNSARLEDKMSMLAYYSKGQFKVANESYTGRIAPDNSSGVVFTEVTVKDSGFYKCRIDYSGSEENYRVLLKVGVSPTIQPLSDIEVLEETLIKIVCNVSGLPAPHVGWYYNYSNPEKVVVTSHVLEIKNIKISHSGLYYCNATNYMKTVIQRLQIKVYKKPSVREFYHVGSLDGVIWECQDMKMLCEMERNFSLRIRNYILYKNGKLMRNQSNSGMFVIHRVGLKNSGTYACVPETRLGMGRNKTLRLRVRGAPKMCKGNSTSSFEFSSETSSTVKRLPFTRATKTSRNSSTKRGYFGALFACLTFSVIPVIFMNV